MDAASEKGQDAKDAKDFLGGWGGSGKMTAFFHRWLVMTNNIFIVSLSWLFCSDKAIALVALLRL